MNYKKLFKFPFILLRKIINFFKIELDEYKNPYNKRYELLINKYQLCGFKKNRSIYINKLNKTLKALNFPIYDESNGMYSEHLVIFSAIASSNLKIKNKNRTIVDLPFDLNATKINVNVDGFYEEDSEKSLSKMKKFQNNLERTGNFKSVSISQGKKVDKSKSYFSIKIVY